MFTYLAVGGGAHSSRETLYHIATLNEQRRWDWEWVSKYKVACMCFSTINASGPAYLSELLHVYTPSRALRSSSDTRMLKIHKYKRKTHGFRIFSCFGPHLLNSLPQDLRHWSTLSSFKAKLKTFLFLQYFRPNINTQFLPRVCVCVCVCVCDQPVYVCVCVSI